MRIIDRLSIREIRALALLENRILSLREISHELGIAPSSSYGMLTKLQALGLVKRNKAKQFEITERGREILAEIKQLLAG